MKLIALFVSALLSLPMFGQQDLFPDGTPIPEWFRQNEIVNIRDLGTAYNLADYGVVNDSTVLQTEKIQAVIDRAAEQGGVVIVPKGTYLTGALFFKPRTHLHLEEGATLKGSDDISNFPIVDTRIEGQSVKYFSALINADKVNGFTISGSGTINGNGLRYWKCSAASGTPNAPTWTRCVRVWYISRTATMCNSPAYASSTRPSGPHTSTAATT